MTQTSWLLVKKVKSELFAKKVEQLKKLAFTYFMGICTGWLGIYYLIYLLK